MSTERMSNEVLTVAEMTITKVLLEVHRARRVEQEQAETIQDQARLIVSLRDQLRLANDKMAEQVRQARWEVATEALERLDPASCAGEQYLQQVRDANAPKD